VINIRRAAVLLHRTLLRPGARFSLNERLGKRTRARGFVAAPSISGPIHVDSVGGAVSQVATTLYNAAFFAGLRLIAHTPHSFYNSRYPKGREATISWRGRSWSSRTTGPRRSSWVSDTGCTFRSVLPADQLAEENPMKHRRVIAITALAAV
jgi:hypothetical protein